MSTRPNLCDLNGCNTEVLTEDKIIPNPDNSTTIIPGNGRIGQIEGVQFDGCCADHFKQVALLILSGLQDKPQEHLPPAVHNP